MYSICIADDEKSVSYTHLDVYKRQLVDKSLELFMKEWTEHGHVHEYYNSENGYGDDVLNSDRNYAWGGLLVLMTLMEEGLA